MQVELNKEELDMIGQALNAYQDEPMKAAVIQTVIMAALIGKDPGDKEKHAVLDNAKIESELRRNSSLGLRLKLMHAAAYKAPTTSN